MVLQSIVRRMLRHLTLDVKFDFAHIDKKSSAVAFIQRECILRDSSLLNGFPIPKALARDDRPPENRPPESRPPKHPTTNPDPKSLTRESGSPELVVCISIMQEPMLGHLTVLRSPVPSAFGSPERRGSTDPNPKSVKQKRVDPQSSEFA